MDTRFVITAEFDLALGATIRDHYPRSEHPLLAPQSQLASLLLPEQVHKRSTDWTYVILHESKATGELSLFAIEDETRPLYVINVIQTENDPKLERGQRVTSLAVVTSQLWFPVLKPVILLASSAYAQTTDHDERASILEELHNSMRDAYSASEFPEFTWLEKRLLQLSSDPNTLKTTLISGRARRQSSLIMEASRNSSAPPIPPRSGYRTRSDSISSNLKLRASSLTLNDFGRDASTSPEPSNPQSMRRSSLRGLIMKNNDREKEAMTANLELLAAPLADVHVFDANINFRNIRLPLKIPTDVTEHLVGLPSMLNLASTLSECSEVEGLCDDITVYGAHTPPLISLACAILAQRRVIIVGNESGSVANLCDLTLAAAQLGSAGGFLQQTNKVFPYADLNVAEELKNSKGYIAATTNAAFMLHPDWFDLAIDIKNKRLVISPSIRSEGGKARSTHVSSADRAIIVALDPAKSDVHTGSQTHQQLERAASENCAAWAQALLRKIASSDMNMVANTLTREKSNCKAVGEIGYPWPLHENSPMDYGAETDFSASSATLGQIASSMIVGSTAVSFAAASGASATGGGSGSHNDVFTANQAATNDIKGNITGVREAYAAFTAVYGSTAAAWKKSVMPRQFGHFLGQTYWGDSGSILVDFYYTSRMLLKEKLSRQDSAHLLETIASGLQTENDTIRFILEAASIYSFSLGLFHPDSSNAVCQALARAKEYVASDVLFAELPQFHINAFERMWERFSHEEFEFCRRELPERPIEDPAVSLRKTPPILSLSHLSDPDSLTLPTGSNFQLA